ncbi:MAG: hypothetical protein AAF226_05505, partial [Verrucomicrobiota bacterium]
MNYDNPQNYLSECKQCLKEGMERLADFRKKLNAAESKRQITNEELKELDGPLAEADARSRDASLAYSNARSTSDLSPEVRGLKNKGGLLKLFLPPVLLTAIAYCGAGFANFALPIPAVVVIFLALLFFTFVVLAYLKGKSKASDRKLRQSMNTAETSCQKFEAKIAEAKSDLENFEASQRDKRKSSLFNAYGYHRADLTQFLANYGRARGDGTAAIDTMPLLTKFMLENQGLSREMKALFDKTQQENAMRRYLFSFLFSRKLLSDTMELTDSRFTDLFCSTFKTDAFELALADHPDKNDPIVAEDFRIMIEEVEVIFSDDVDEGECYFAHKARPADDSKVDFIIQKEPESDKASQLLQWQSSDRGWYSVSTDVLLCDARSEIIVGPPGGDARKPLPINEGNVRIENHYSSMTDIANPDAQLAGRIEAAALHGNRYDEVLQELGLNVIEQTESFFVPTDIRIRELKGSVVVVGYWEEGEWHD